MKNLPSCLALLLLIPVILVGCSGGSEPEVEPSSFVSADGAQVKVIETGPLHIDKIYTSMVGPSQRVAVDFSDLDWVTGIRTDVLNALTGEPMGEEFFCHAQLQLPDSYRPMVTATGVSAIRFPDGFGMPIREMIGVFKSQFDRENKIAQPLSFFGMVLNNHEPDIDVQAKIRATIEYRTAADAASPPLKRLYRAPLTMTVEDLAQYVPAETTPEEPDVASHCALVEGANYHWLVPPGPQITRLRIPGSDFLVDTQVHYIVVHLHNHAKYMRLTDATTGEKLWQADVEYEPDRLQIAGIPVYSSVEGFTLKASHEYEIEAFYDNTTDAVVDAMAMMSIYHHPPIEAALGGG